MSLHFCQVVFLSQIQSEGGAERLILLALVYIFFKFSIFNLTHLLTCLCFTFKYTIFCLDYCSGRCSGSFPGSFLGIGAGSCGWITLNTGNLLFVLLSIATAVVLVGAKTEI